MSTFGSKPEARFHAVRLLTLLSVSMIATGCLEQNTTTAEESPPQTPPPAATEKSALDLGTPGWTYDERLWQEPRQFFVSIAPAQAGRDSEIHIRALAQDWNNTITRHFLLPPDASRVRLTGRVATRHVERGPEHFMAARVQMRFLDEAGAQIGGWPQGEILSGTNPSRAFSLEHMVPRGAAVLEVMLGLVNSSGEVSYHSPALSMRLADGKWVSPQEPAQEVRTDVTGWNVFTPPQQEPTGETLNISRILGRKPLTQEDKISIDSLGRFVNTRGEPLRFWGTNISPPQTWPDEDEAVKLADRFARAGINIVRFHHMDRGWHQDNIFLKDSPDTQSLDPDKLARMDNLIQRLSERGIYVFIDLLVTRKFRPGDGVPEHENLNYGAKIAAHFCPGLIELQKLYARQLLGHRRSATGATLAEDPALAMVSIINESSAFLRGSLSTSHHTLPVHYRALIDQMHAEWRRERGLPIPSRSVADLVNANDEATFQFLEEIQDKHYQIMNAELRSLGYKGPIAGSNFQEVFADVRSNARLDFYDTHGYWAHPTSGWGPENVPNHPLSKALGGRDNPFHNWAAQRIAAMPFVISEWQACWPNEHIAEMPLLMAIIGSRQSWDGMLWFGLSTTTFSQKMSSVFEAGEKPHVMPVATAAALLYLRGDITPAAMRAVSLDGLPRHAAPRSSLQPNEIFTNQIVRTLDDPHRHPKAVTDKDDSAQPAQWHPQGYTTLRVPTAVAVAGFSAGGEITLDGVRLKLETPFSNIVLVSLDALPLESSNHLLLVTTARAENTDQSYRAFKNGIKSLGTAPILMEPVKGILEVSSWRSRRGLHIRSLDANGTPYGGWEPVSESSLLPLDGFLWRELRFQDGVSH